MRKRSLLLSIFIIIPFLTACWDYREVDGLTIVVGFAVDKTDKGDYLLTFEVADMSEAGKEGKVKSVLIESEGETLLDAIRNTISKNYPRLYFGHAVCVILSQDVARDGVLNVLDFITRDSEVRLSIYLFVSEEETAKELLKAKPLTSELLMLEISNILEEQKDLSKAFPVQVYEFVNALGEEGFSGVMTSICSELNDEEEVIKLCGTAVFKEDKLQGFINGEETKALCFILDEIKGGVIVVKTGFGEDESRISLEILRSSTKIKPVYVDNKLSIEVDIDISVFLDEHISKENYYDKEGIVKLQKTAGMQLKDEIESFVRKVQSELNSDIFGFGNSVYRDLPVVWKKEKDKWDQTFKDLEVSVNPHIEIVHAGLLSEPIMMGD
jgi:spore germination protein KC